MGASVSVAFDQKRLSELIKQEKDESLFPALKKSQLETLQNFLTPGDMRELASAASLTQNRRVRELLRPTLLHGRPEKKQEVCTWIVKNWGGIKAHDQSRFIDLVQVFEDFSVPTIEDRIRALGFDRISSWSKLISFAHPHVYPVYDAKAVSKLNSLLIGPEKTRFYVPPTQVKVLKGAQNAIICFGYREYCELLRGAAKLFDVTLLEVESSLFSHAIFI